MTALEMDITTELSPLEASDLRELEGVIARGQQTFLEVGTALAQIRDERLYRAEHATFEAYLTIRWPEIGRRRAYQLMDAAQVAAVVNHGAQTPPITNERQARPLAGLAPEQARAAYDAAVEQAGGKAPTGKQVEQAAAAYKQPANWQQIVDLANSLGIELEDNHGEYAIIDHGERKVASQWGLVVSYVRQAESDSWSMLLRPAAGGGWEVVKADGRVIGPQPTASRAREAGRNAVAPIAVPPPGDPIPPSATVTVIPPRAPSVTEERVRAVLLAKMRVANTHYRLEDRAQRLQLRQLAADLIAAIDAVDAPEPEPTTPAAPTAAQDGPDVPETLPADIAARCAALGLETRRTDEGWLTYWPHENPDQHAAWTVIGALQAWLLSDAPALIDRDPEIVLPGVGYAEGVQAGPGDLYDLAVLLGDLAASEAGARPSTPLAELASALEGMADLLDDVTYSALANRISALETER